MHLSHILTNLIPVLNVILFSIIGEMALHRAAAEGRLKAMNALLQSGADVSLKDKVSEILTYVSGIKYIEGCGLLKLKFKLRDSFLCIPFSVILIVFFF